LQLVRFVQAWPVSVNNIVVPVSFSAIAFVVVALLAVMTWRER
jgi:hypothetical protein